MKLTPLDIRHQEFSAGFSGYAKRQVREFLNQIADQFEAQERDFRAQAEKISKLETAIEELKGAEDSLKRAIIAAEHIGNEMKASAEREAGIIRREAEANKEKMLSEAFNQLSELHSELNRLKAERTSFSSQFHALLEGYMASLKSFDHKKNEDEK